MNGLRPPRHKQLVVGNFFKPSNCTASQKASIGEDMAVKAGQDAAAVAKKRPPKRPRLTSSATAGGVSGEEQQCNRVPAFTCTCTRAHTHAYTRAYACTCVCIHTHTHAYACTCSSEGQNKLAYAHIAFIIDVLLPLHCSHWGLLIGFYRAWH